MMTAANIKYNVDEVNKTVTATVDGCTYDAINLMLKAFRRKNLILTGMDIDKVTTVNPDETHVDENDVNLKVHMYPMITCKKFLLKDTYEGTAIYHPDDNNLFSHFLLTGLEHSFLNNQKQIRFLLFLERLFV